MDSMFPNWLLPLWIIVAPILAILADHMFSSKTTSMNTDRMMPQYAATPKMA